MVGNISRKISKSLLNLASWHTDRKIIVIDSDDWGSIRMPSKEVYNKLLGKGFKVDRDAYNRFDSLASERDLSHLFDVLSRYKDKNGNNPVITANAVVANPDFEKIRESDFSAYFHEPFTETLKRYPEHANSFSLWQEGMTQKLFRPQFHGREHLNVDLWLKALQGNVGRARDTFEYGLLGVNSEDTIGNRDNYMAAFDTYSAEDEQRLHGIIAEGLDLFEKKFRYQATSFIAPCYTWGEDLEKALHQKGIRYIQSIAKQKVPGKISKKGSYGVKFHRCGQKNSNGQYYLVRNCFFEPSHSTKLWGYEPCLRNVENAFFWRTPAIISTHRLNFIGFIDERNRDTNLRSFDTMLKEIVKKWPEVEFMTSEQLGDIIAQRSYDKK